MSIKPATRPQLPLERARAILAKNGIKDKVVLLAVRGYFRNSMGKPNANDVGLYDDAIFLITPDSYKAFNANTDPSIRRPGIATLVPGVHPYRKGKHGITRPGGGYPALRPATEGEELPVTRDGVVNPRPGVAINIHKGSKTSTSSEGCQTIHPDQWPEFIDLVYRAMARWQQPVVPYVLVVNDGSIA